MKTYTILTTHTTGILARWARLPRMIRGLLGAMLMISLIVPAVAFSQPAAPVLNLPADGATLVSTSPTLSWIAVVGDSVYHLQISMSIGFADTVYNDSTLTGVSHLISGLANNTPYYWRVSVKDSASAGGGMSAYSIVRSFTTWLSTPTPIPPPLPVALGSTSRFAILSAAGITDVPPSVITGDVGTSPITGASIDLTQAEVAGTIFCVGAPGPAGHTVDPTLLTQAIGDLTTAYNDAAGRIVNPISISGNLGGRTLYPGLYKSNGTLEISAGDLTLDAQNDTNAVWIFQIASSFNMTSGRKVFLSGGALASNVFWQMGTRATFGTTTVMKGTILAGAEITFATGATLGGRALGQTAVTLQSTTVTRPAIPVVYTNPTTAGLLTSGNFRVLAGGAVTIASGCTVNGDVGAGTTVTHTGATINGTSYNGGANVTTAVTDLGKAIDTIALGRTADATLNPQLAGTTLGRGVYASTNGTFDITGTLILTGTATDIFIFQTGSTGTTLTTGANSHVMLVGGALASNVFWQVKTAATLGINSDFKGIIMASTDITQNSGATIDGRALALTGAVSVLGTGTSVLPVELVSFTATANSMNAELRWSTATEVNNYGFDVERRLVNSQSSTVNSWGKIGFVKGSGTSNSAHSYSYTDASVSSGTYVYRLKQIDNNGTYKYSSEAELTVSVPKVFALNQNYPNPFNPTTKITFTLAQDGFTTLKIYDVLGREVTTLVNGEMKSGVVNTVSFNATKFSSGVYFYRLEAGSFVSIKKLMLMK